MAHDHYQNLGLSPTASPDEIKQAYRAKAKDLHPDKGGDPVEFASVAKAYEVLGNPQKKLLYDTAGVNQRPPLEVEVQNILMELFNQALSSGEDIAIVETVRKVIKTRVQGQIPDECRKLKIQQKKQAHSLQEQSK